MKNQAKTKKKGKQRQKHYNRAEVVNDNRHRINPKLGTDHKHLNLAIAQTSQRDPHPSKTPPVVSHGVKTREASTDKSFTL